MNPVNLSNIALRFAVILNICLVFIYLDTCPAQNPPKRKGGFGRFFKKSPRNRPFRLFLNPKTKRKHRPRHKTRHPLSWAIPRPWLSGLLFSMQSPRIVTIENFGRCYCNCLSTEEIPQPLESVANARPTVPTIIPTITTSWYIGNAGSRSQLVGSCAASCFC